MTELVLTEHQWRIVARIEELAKDRWFFAQCVKKPMLHASFPPGEWYIAWAVNQQLGPAIFGPPSFTFSVVEWPSRMCIGAVNDGVPAAISLARQWLADLTLDTFEVLRSRMAESVAQRAVEEAERSAHIEAQAAIASAQSGRKVSKRARAVFNASGGACHYCARPLSLMGKWHIEHKMPRALKGGSEMHNLVAACVPCNMRKKDKTDLEFQALLATESVVTQTAQGGIEGADEGGGSLALHSSSICPAEPRNATQLFCGGLRA